jgi:hypothetical protein
MRIAIATLIGGLVMFFWGAFAHMVLPLGEMSMRAPTNEDAVLTALREGLPAEQGIYILPHFDMAVHGNEQAQKAYSEKAKANPYAFIVYSPDGKDPLQMGGNLFHQWLSDTFAALLVALVLIRAGAGVLRGLWIGLAFGVFSWLSLCVPYWNWYRFPGAFTAGTLIEQAFGWLLAGAAMGWWLSRKPDPATLKPLP